MTARITHHADGSTTTSTHGFASSNDYKQEGIEVVRGFGSTTVASPDLLLDDDLVTVSGVQMPTRVAREYGLIATASNPSHSPDQIDPSVSLSAAEPTDDTQRPNTGHEGYDKVASDIMDRVDAGQLDGQEAFTYDLAVATVASADLTITEVVDILDGIESGELNAMDVDTNSRQVAQSVEKYVTDAATKSAKSELGQTGFDRLSQLAAASPTVDQALRQYVSMRSLGRSGDSWNDFLQMAEEELGF